MTKKLWALWVGVIVAAMSLVPVRAGQAGATGFTGRVVAEARAARGVDLDRCENPITAQVQAQCSAEDADPGTDPHGAASADGDAVLSLDADSFIESISTAGNAGAAHLVDDGDGQEHHESTAAFATEVIFDVESPVVLDVSGSLDAGGTAEVCAQFFINGVVDVRAPGSSPSECNVVSQATTVVSSVVDEQITLAPGTYTLLAVARVEARNAAFENGNASFDIDILFHDCDNEFTAGDDTIDGSNGATADDDVLCGGAGNDTISGLGGNDRIYGDAGNDTVLGGDNDDVLFGGEDDDIRLYGGPGNDTLDGGPGNDGADAIAGNSVAGGAGNDTISGGPGIDTIVGGCVADALLGDYQCSPDDPPDPLEPDRDTVEGEGEDDKIFGGDDRDTLRGGEGVDVIDGANGNDTIDGGPGNEFLGSNPRSAAIDGGAGDDTIHGGIGDDLIDGGLDNDDIFGDAGSDKLRGESGNDCIVGGANKDVLVGGAENDKLIARGGGSDAVKGGGGNRDKATVDTNDAPVTGVERFPSGLQCL